MAVTLLETKQKTVTLRVQRYSGLGEEPHVASFEIQARKGMTVNDALFLIKENLDSSLSWRVSCRMGICGSCGMLINNTPRLACQTQLLAAGDDVNVGPLPNYPVIKDLVVDMDELYRKHRKIKPYIVREGDEQEHPTREYLQKPSEMDEYLQFSYCITCGLCNAACPVISTDEKFIGPQALAQAYRYVADNRDSDPWKRLDIIDEAHGVWRCHFAGACSQVCPRGVDPALAIQLLRQQSVRRTIGFGKVEKRLAQVSAR